MLLHRRFLRCWLLVSLPVRLVGLGCVFVLTCPIARAQSLRKLERQAINRTHLTFVNGDTVQRFTITDDHPHPRPGRFYYWQGPGRILRTAGAYDGRLLTGGYQLTSRAGYLLGSGHFHKGLKTGQWRTWRPDGTPLSSSRWRRGRQRGQLRQYDEAGQLLRPVPVVPATTASSAAATPARPHFWQPHYWQQVWTRHQQRRAEKPPRQPVLQPGAAQPATPAGSLLVPPTTSPAKVKIKPGKDKKKDKKPAPLPGSPSTPQPGS